jgi:hypothetical protein
MPWKTKKLLRRNGRNASSAAELAATNSTTFLYAEDLEEVQRMVSARGKSESETIRDIVHEWMRIKKKKALVTEAATSPEQIRNLIGELVARELTPLREKQSIIGDGIREILAMIARLKHPSPTTEYVDKEGDQWPASGELLSLLQQLENHLTAARQEISATRNEVGEGVSSQLHHLDRLLTGSQAQYTLLGQSFICNWTTLDFVVKYLVETSLRSGRVDPNQVETETNQDREHLRDYGVEIIRAMEKEMGLPIELCLKMIAPLVPATTHTS